VRSGETTVEIDVSDPQPRNLTEPQRSRGQDRHHVVLDEAARDGVINRNPAKDRARRRTMGMNTGDETGPSPRDLALPDFATLDLLVERAAAAGKHQSYGVGG